MAATSASPDGDDVAKDSTLLEAAASGKQVGEPKLAADNRVPLKQALKDLLTTWGGRTLAVVLGIGGILGCINAGITLYNQTAAATRRPLPVNIADLNQLLPAAQTPPLGVPSSQLGYGDSLGGRPTYPYTPNGSEGHSTPILNSLVGFPGVGDEEEFVRGVATSAPSKYWPGQVRVGFRRQVILTKRDPYLDLWVYLDNNASFQQSCAKLVGSTVASGISATASIWTDPSGIYHVVRVWISSFTATPHWMTDAILVRTPPHTSLTLIPGAGTVYRKLPPLRSKPIGANFVHYPGVTVGGGLLGSCYSNREVIFALFREGH